MDPSIGEASSVMGAMLTELLRRSLRGGVMRLGEELHGYASERVEAAIVEQTPALERAATVVAETAARATAATVAQEQVQSVEEKAREGDRQLAVQLEEAARDLGGRIVGVEQKAVEVTTTTARTLTTRIEEAEKQAQDTTLETARGLASQIQETEQRVTDFAKTEISQQVQELLARARRKAAALEGRFQELEARTVALRNQVLEEQAALGGRLDQEGKGWRDEVAALLRTNEALAARVAELEKPRGLRALWVWMFGPRSGNGKAKKDAAVPKPKGKADHA